MCLHYLVPLKGLATKIGFSSVSIILTLLAMIGNGIVVYVVIKTQSLHQPTPILIAALASCDVITAAWGQVTVSVSVVFNKLSCEIDKMIGFIHYFSGSTSLMILLLIARDRYLHVTKLINYNQFTNVKKVIISLAFCNVIGTALATLHCIDQPRVKASAALVFAVIAVCCFGYICHRGKKIACIVNAHNERTSRALEQDNTEKDERPNGARRRQELSALRVNKTVNRSILAVAVLFALSWLPVTIIAVMYTFYEMKEVPLPAFLPKAANWAILAYYISCAVNPFLYGYRCDQIGREIRRFINPVTRFFGFKSEVNAWGT